MGAEVTARVGLVAADQQPLDPGRPEPERPLHHRQQPRIARIDPNTGNVTGIIDLSGLAAENGDDIDRVLNGIAYDAQRDRLFVTGKYWPRLYEIDLVPAR